MELAVILPVIVQATHVSGELLTLNFSLVETITSEVLDLTDVRCSAIRVQSGMIYYVKETPEQLAELAKKEVAQQIHQGAVTIGRYRSTLR